jgi:hypothetical protein
MAIPGSTAAYPRALLTAHLELTQNGMLQAIMGIATLYMDLSAPVLAAYEVLTAIGTWANGLAFVAAAFDSKVSPGCPFMIAAFPPAVITEKSLNHNILTVCVMNMLSSLVLGLYGLRKRIWPGNGKALALRVLDGEASKEH